MSLVRLFTQNGVALPSPVETQMYTPPSSLHLIRPSNGYSATVHFDGRSVSLSIQLPNSASGTERKREALGYTLRVNGQVVPFSAPRSFSVEELPGVESRRTLYQALLRLPEGERSRVEVYGPTSTSPEQRLASLELEPWPLRSLPWGVQQLYEPAPVVERGQLDWQATHDLVDRLVRRGSSPARVIEDAAKMMLESAEAAHAKGQLSASIEQLDQGYLSRGLAGNLALAGRLEALVTRMVEDGGALSGAERARLDRLLAVGVYYRQAAATGSRDTMVLAAEALDRAARAFDDAKLPLEAAETRVHLGRALDNLASSAKKSGVPAVRPELLERASAAYASAAEALSRAPDNPSPRLRQQMLHLAVNRAFHAGELGQADEAIRILERAAEDTRGAAEVRIQVIYNLARLYLDRDPKEALRLLSELIPVATDGLSLGIVLQNAGVAESKQGHHDAALALFERALASFEGGGHRAGSEWTQRLIEKLPPASLTAAP